ncbi:hypothetical protein KAU09_04905 [Candidatus Parcubacteria bacterium]|nr:hypothetical protein [Candidatus Parcubacteria bacterium]
MFTLLFIFIIISSLFLGVLVYRNNPRGLDNRYFLIFNFLLVFWLVANYLENEMINEKLRIIFLYADFVISPIWGYFWFLFCYSFLENKKINKIINYIFIFLLFFITIITLTTGLVIKKVYFYNNILNFDTGALHLLFAAIILFSFVGGSVILFFKYRRFQNKKKIQTLYVLIGFSLASVVVATVNLFFQNKLTVDLYRLGNSFLVFIIIFTSYAIIKHQLLDIKVVIQRGIIYSILFSVVVGVYLILMFLLGFFFQQTTDVAMMLAALTTTMVCVYTVPIIERYFKKWTDKIFFKDKYDYSEAVFSLSEVLNKNIGLNTLLKESAKRLKSILKIKDLRIVLPKQNILLDTKGEVKVKSLGFIKDSVKAIADDDRAYLDHSEIPSLLKSTDKGSEEYKALKMAEIYGKKFNISLTVPIKLENKLMGLLALGKKLSGDIYTGEDYNLLKTFSIQAGVALEKAQLYEKVKNYSKDLEQKVKERVSEIQALQEGQKQMMLEISHGLQTPLTIIKGELHNLENQVADKNNIKYLEKNLDRISMFIYDMLRLARMENQKDKFEKEKFDLSGLLFDLIENFKIITSEKNISLKSSIEKKIFFNGSKKEIEELIMNIVSNSVKYFGDKKNNEINFTLKKKSGIIELSIADTGVGIRKEKIPKLFSRFYRAGKDNRGTGLGLAICKEIVNRHLGEIKVESKEGEGAKFIISLPLIKNENKGGKFNF